MTVPASNRDGSHRFENDQVAMEVGPEAHTLGVMDEKCRCWSITRAGITWPIGDDYA